MVTVDLYGTSKLFQPILQYLFQVYQEFQIQLTELTVDNLLEQFTIAKHTGLEKPGRWEVFSYQSSLKHSPLKKPASTGTNTIMEGTKRPEKLLIQTSSVSPTTSNGQGKAYTLICTSKSGWEVTILTNSNPCHIRDSKSSYITKWCVCTLS